MKIHIDEREKRQEWLFHFLPRFEESSYHPLEFLNTLFSLTKHRKLIERVLMNLSHFVICSYICLYLQNLLETPKSVKLRNQ
jgi:hypothetical protein